MRVTQGIVSGSDIAWAEPNADHRNADLVLYFGARETLSDAGCFPTLRALFPDAHLFGCGTGGRILGDDVTDVGVAVTAISFDDTQIEVYEQPLSDISESEGCGRAIGEKLKRDDLAGVFVLSDGLGVNGSKLVAGLTSVLGPDIPLTGGLAGDGDAFQQTVVGADSEPRGGIVGAIGFYGAAIKFGYGSAGGWDVFGPRRRISRARGSTLYELDGEPALDLYERYLGPEESKGLPGTALLFPLEIFDPDKPNRSVVRTVLSVDHAAAA